MVHQDYINIYVTGNWQLHGLYGALYKPGIVNQVCNNEWS